MNSSYDENNAEHTYIANECNMLQYLMKEIVKTRMKCLQFVLQTVDFLSWGRTDVFQTEDEPLCVEGYHWNTTITSNLAYTPLDLFSITGVSHVCNSMSCRLIWKCHKCVFINSFPLWQCQSVCLYVVISTLYVVIYYFYTKQTRNQPKKREILPKYGFDKHALRSCLSCIFFHLEEL